MVKVVLGALVLLVGSALVPEFFLLWLVFGVVMIAMGLQDRAIALRERVYVEQRPMARGAQFTVAACITLAIAAAAYYSAYQP